MFKFEDFPLSKINCKASLKFKEPAQSKALYSPNEWPAKYLNELNVLIEHINTHHNYFFIKNNYLYLVESFIKKKAKIGLDNDKIKKRLNEIDIENKLENFTVCKIINYMST